MRQEEYNKDSDRTNETIESLTLSLAENQLLIKKISSENDDLKTQLADARSHILAQVTERLIFESLKFLSKRTQLISDRRRAKLLKSAMKRDPLRSIKSLNSEHNGTIVASAGRRGNFTGKLPRHKDRKNIIIFCHDATETGAPILGYNAAFNLSDTYNVTIVCLKGGALSNNMQSACCSFSIMDGAIKSGSNSWNALRDIVSSTEYTFAIVNSVESRSVLPLLRELNIPSISLLHEFAAYTFPPTAFSEVCQNSSEIVFSSEITLENAIEFGGVVMAPNIHVIPQGKSEVPNSKKTEDERFLERNRLSLRLKKSNEDDILVVGAGSVLFRKGVDLFIEVARDALGRNNGRGMKFCWIGAGYDPKRDSGYSVYLSDQINRSGIKDKFIMLDHTTEIDYIHEISDVFLMTSRLDPLPNVAIDAMCAGSPVICFDKASGFAPILRKGEIGEYCVASYLETSDMANKLIELVRDREKLTNVSSKTKSLADKLFNMKTYVSEIASLGEASSVRALRVHDDIEVISREFQGAGSNFFKFKKIKKISSQHILLPNRRPEPGFNPHIFEEKMRHCKQENSNPYAEYLRQGRPDGIWKKDVLVGPYRPRKSNLRVALHIHAYYIDELPRILRHLHVNATKPDVYISVSDQDAATSAFNLMAGYPSKVVVRIFPNIGRDIAPFITGFGRDLIEGYDVVGHVHTKKSIGVSDKKTIRKWTDFLYENTLGGDRGGAMLDSSIERFENNENLGIIYPSDPNVIGWNLNKREAESILMKISSTKVPNYFDFPVGTMFWLRSAVLRVLVDLKLDWSDYPKEPIPYDGTMLHALERIFGVLPGILDYDAMVTSIEGVMR